MGLFTIDNIANVLAKSVKATQKAVEITKNISQKAWDSTTTALNTTKVVISNLSKLNQEDLKDLVKNELLTIKDNGLVIKSNLLDLIKDPEFKKSSLAKLKITALIGGSLVTPLTLPLYLLGDWLIKIAPIFNELNQKNSAWTPEKIKALMSKENLKRKITETLMGNK